MSIPDSGWQKVRDYQNLALPDNSLDLEIHPDTLEFRVRVNGQTFSGKNGRNVLTQVAEYLRDLPAPGDWQPVIEIARHGYGHMEVKRLYIRPESNGHLVQHAWVEAPDAITVLGISRLDYHTAGYPHQVPPCRHHNGLSSYIHLPYTPAVWGVAQELARTFDTFFSTIGAFLQKISSVTPQENWEAFVLTQWSQVPITPYRDLLQNAVNAISDMLLPMADGAAHQNPESGEFLSACARGARCLEDALEAGVLPDNATPDAMAALIQKVNGQEGLPAEAAEPKMRPSATNAGTFPRNLVDFATRLRRGEDFRAESQGPDEPACSLWYHQGLFWVGQGNTLEPFTEVEPAVLALLAHVGMRLSLRKKRQGQNANS